MNIKKHKKITLLFVCFFITSCKEKITESENKNLTSICEKNFELKDYKLPKKISTKLEFLGINDLDRTYNGCITQLEKILNNIQGEASSVHDSRRTLLIKINKSIEYAVFLNNL